MEPVTVLAFAAGAAATIVAIAVWAILTDDPEQLDPATEPDEPTEADAEDLEESWC